MPDTFIILFVIALIPFTISRAYLQSQFEDIMHNSTDKKTALRLLKKVMWASRSEKLKKELMELCPDHAKIQKYIKSSRICRLFTYPLLITIVLAIIGVI